MSRCRSFVGPFVPRRNGEDMSRIVRGAIATFAGINRTLGLFEMKLTDVFFVTLELYCYFVGEIWPDKFAEGDFGLSCGIRCAEMHFSSSSSNLSGIYGDAFAHA